MCMFNLLGEKFTILAHICEVYHYDFTCTEDGKIIMNSDEYFIVTVNNYRAIGGGNFPHYESDKVLENDPREVQDILINYIVEEAKLTSDSSVNYRVKI